MIENIKQVLVLGLRSQSACELEYRPFLGIPVLEGSLCSHLWAFTGVQRAPSSLQAAPSMVYHCTVCCKQQHPRGWLMGLSSPATLAPTGAPVRLQWGLLAAGSISSSSAGADAAASFIFASRLPVSYDSYLKGPCVSRDTMGSLWLQNASSLCPPAAWVLS